MGSSASAISSVMPLWKAYRCGQGFFDEMFDPELNPRSGCQRVVNGLLCNEPSLINLRARADRMFLQMGVTFNVYGETSGSERIFPFDPIPRVIDAATWSRLEAGLVQRIRAL